MKILFTVPPYHRFNYSAPYGIAIVATVAKKAGFDVQILLSERGESVLSYNERVVCEIQSKSIDVVAIGGQSTHYPQIEKLIAVVKYAGVITVLGGYIVDSLPEIVTRNIGADYCVCGEGEYTFVELMHALQNKTDVSTVKGICFMRDGKFIATAPRECIQDLDELPFLDGDLCRFDYTLERDPTLFLMLSRSCPYQCTFCYHLKGSRYRTKSIDYIFRELDYYLEQYGDKVKELYVMDELINTDKARLMEFCKRIKKYGLPYSAMIRADYLEEEDVIALKESGAHCIGFGLESASNKVLASMRKNSTIEDAEKAISLISKHGMWVEASLIIGDVADDIESIRASEDFFLKHFKYGIRIDLIKVLPGTDLYKHALDNGIIKDELAFLKAGCPYVNVSQLPDNHYALLADKYGAFSLAREVINNRPLEAHPLELSIARDGLVTYACHCPICHAKVTLCGDCVSDRRCCLFSADCPNCYQRINFETARILAFDRDMVCGLAELYFERYSGSQVVIWGVTDKVRKLLLASQKLRDMVVKVVDINHAEFTMESYCGLPVESPQSLSGFEFEYIISPTVERRGEVVKALEDMHISPKFIEIDNTFLNRGTVI